MVSVQQWSPARSHPRERGAAALGRTVVILVTASAIGALTAYAQGWCRGPWWPLPNSAGPWVLVAFALAALTRTEYGAALAGTAVLWLLEMGYAVGDQVRGHPSSTTSVSFWLMAAVLAGPAIGLAGHWVRRRQARPAALGAGLLAGSLVGEAVRMLLDLDPRVYPWGQLVLAAVLFVVMARRRFPHPADVALSAAVAVPVAVVVMVFLHRS